MTDVLSVKKNKNNIPCHYDIPLFRVSYGRGGHVSSPPKHVSTHEVIVTANIHVLSW